MATGNFTKGGGGHRQLTVRAHKVRSRSASSRRWIERQLNDPYVAQAKREGLRSRAAFKLVEIDSKYRLLRPGLRVADLGAAPGGWSEIAAAKVEPGGQIVAVDILDMEPLPGVSFLRSDFTEEGVAEKLRGLLRDGEADVVLSDMAGATTGHASTDHLRIMALAEAAAEFAFDVLAPGGAFLCKVLQGGTERALLNRLKQKFRDVRHVKPPASRAESAELYVLAMGFKGRGE